MARRNRKNNTSGKAHGYCYFRDTLYTNDIRESNNNYGPAETRTYGHPEGYDYFRDTLYRNDEDCYGGEEQYQALYNEARHASRNKPPGGVYCYNEDNCP